MIKNIKLIIWHFWVSRPCYSFSLSLLELGLSFANSQYQNWCVWILGDWLKTVTTCVSVSRVISMKKRSLVYLWIHHGCLTVLNQFISNDLVHLIGLSMLILSTILSHCYLSSTLNRTFFNSDKIFHINLWIRTRIYWLSYISRHSPICPAYILLFDYH